MVFSTNPKHSPILATIKKIDSIPAKTSTEISLYTQAGKKQGTEKDIIAVCDSVKGLEELIYEERLKQLYVHIVDWVNNESGHDLYTQ